MTTPEASGVFDADRLAQCVQCGFCLSSCPTYELTHLEEYGPRGRILAMRLVQEGELAIDDPDVKDSLETCVQCRACEAVCPSLVDFGSLMETARAELAERQPPSGLRGLAHRAGFASLRRHGLLRAPSCSGLTWCSRRGRALGIGCGSRSSSDPWPRRRRLRGLPQQRPQDAATRSSSVAA